MAMSPSHRWGQIIGQEFLEVAMYAMLSETAKQHNLYLDQKGQRTARPGKKIVWMDVYGNSHDLDFVLEKNGSETQIGTPVAFIESAWRRYTKHSRNKAQEIQGAILPLVQTHGIHAPFIGVILAGDFTDGAKTQLRSHRFRVLHFSYDSLIAAFKTARIDASFDEDTPDAECAMKVMAWNRLSKKDRRKLAIRLLEDNKAQVKEFIGALEAAILRLIKLVRVLPLHGSALEIESLDKAIAFVEAYHETDAAPKPVARYEILIRYDNDDEIKGTFLKKEDALQFLRSYLPPLTPVVKPSP